MFYMLTWLVMNKGYKASPANFSSMSIAADRYRYANGNKIIKITQEVLRKIYYGNINNDVFTVFSIEERGNADEYTERLKLCIYRSSKFTTSDRKLQYFSYPQIPAPHFLQVYVKKMILV